MIDFQRQLNQEQWECVKHVSSPQLIFAGAGTGKTRVIAFKIAYLIQSLRLSSSSILAVTFTNKSAIEMRERISALVGRKDARGMTVSTFHALGVKILEKYITTIGYNRKFIIYDDAEQLNVIERIMSEFNLNKEEIKPKQVQWVVQKIKNSISGWGVEDVKPLFRNIHDRYCQYLKNCNAVDFDDLLLKPLEILENNEEARNYYRTKFRYLLVDEYQDTNPVQYSLLKQLLGPQSNICVVGDDDQSIYSWRGSDLEIILNFQRDFKDAKVFYLTKNYRSTTTILEAAHSVISKNVKREAKKLWSDNGVGEKISYNLCLDEEDEAEFVSKRIMAFKVEKKMKWSDFAVLYRTNFQSRPIEMACRGKGIPYRLIGGQNFFDRKEVRDFLAYLKVIANTKDDISVRRIINYPKRGIGDSTVARIDRYGLEHHKSFFEVVQHHSHEIGVAGAAVEGMASFTSLMEDFRSRMLSENANLSDVARELVKSIGFERQFIDEGMEEDKVRRKMMNISEVVNSMKSFGKDNEKGTLYDYLKKVALMSDNDEDDDPEKEIDKVTLLTVHASKGLEFNNIFIVGLENDLFPHRRSMEDNEDSLEEERRLFYVAVTRGRKLVLLTSADKRKIFGKEVEKEVSQFVMEIPDQYIQKQDDERQKPLTNQEKADGMRKILERLKQKNIAS